MAAMTTTAATQQHGREFPGDNTHYATPWSGTSLWRLRFGWKRPKSVVPQRWERFAHAKGYGGAISGRLEVPPRLASGAEFLGWPSKNGARRGVIFHLKKGK